MFRTPSRWLSMPTSVKVPRVVVITGATGTGKSQLAVALAQKHNGEVINGDALQLYEGLPIATNKVPVSDRKSIPHHLLGCVKWDEEPWMVGKYVTSAIGIIQDIVAREKLPIIAGGTHYYIQSLLFEHSLALEHNEHQPTQVQEKNWPILSASTTDMLEELRRIDPEEASHWHPRDRRKIRHSLGVRLSLGQKSPDLYQEQCTTGVARSSLRTTGDIACGLEETRLDNATPFLRFDPLILWIYADMNHLAGRLNERVDGMVAAGLLEEVAAMQGHIEEQEQLGSAVDRSTGIWSAIGFKQLHPYVSALGNNGVGNEEIAQAKARGIEQTKIATRQYAKQQQRWIRGKLLRALEKQNALNRIVLLNGTDPQLWDQNVEHTATAAVSAFLNGEQLPDNSGVPTAESGILVPNAEPDVRARYCKICDMTLMTRKQWDAHPKSKKHRKATRMPKDWQALFPRSKNPPDAPYTGLTPEKG